MYFKYLFGALAFFTLFGAGGSTPKLRRIAGLRAESGVFSVTGNTLAAFPHGELDVLDPNTKEWKVVPKSSGGKELIVQNNGWRWTAPTRSVSSANEFALCDALNQVDIKANHSELRAALPPTARVKLVQRISDNASLAVYSTSDATVRYPLYLGIVANGALADSDLVTESGTFCGVLGGGVDPTYILMDEPSGSSDYSAVYVYAISK